MPAIRIVAGLAVALALNAVAEGGVLFMLTGNSRSPIRATPVG